MNVESITQSQILSALPLGVTTTGDDGVYSVKSGSRPGLFHRVDVTMLQCNCESATKGKSRKNAIKGKDVPTYSGMCPHLKLAIAYDGIVLRTVLGRVRASRGQ